MLRDFAKLETFLTVVREKSFSKASAKLGISQPAVTQQMKFIEDYLDVQVVDRKKNGIKLTKEGQMLHAIALKIEKCVANGEKELLKIMNKNVTFVFGASFIIGNYILPRFLNNLKENIHNDVSINVSVSHEAIEDLLDKKIDIALVENYVTNDDIIYKELMEDEIVIFSNQKLPEKAKAEDQGRNHPPVAGLALERLARAARTAPPVISAAATIKAGVACALPARIRASVDSKGAAYDATPSNWMSPFFMPTSHVKNAAPTGPTPSASTDMPPRIHGVRRPPTSPPWPMRGRVSCTR